MLAAFEGKITGASHFDYTIGLNQIEKCGDFIGVTGHFNIHALGGDIDNFCAKNIANLHHLGALIGRRVDFDYDQLPFGGLTVGKFSDLKDVDQFVDLFNGLVECFTVADNGRGDARELLIHHRAYVERFDIETTPTEHSSDASKDSELIFDKN